MSQMENFVDNSPAFSMDTSTAAEKIPELWFSDADCVFQAGTKLFRVHRGILCARSPIFNDMFAVPHREKEQKTCGPDSYTHILLPDDAMDVYYFFLAIFDAAFFEPPPSEQPIHVIISILRLAHKYEVAFLKRRAVAHLNKLFPTTWEAWRQVRKAVPYRFAEEKDKAAHDLFPLLELGQIAEIPWIVPVVFHSLTRYPLDVIFQLDGWSALDKSAQQKFLVSCAEAIKSRVVCGKWLLGIPAPYCRDQTRCTDCTFMRYGRELEGMLDVLYPCILSNFCDHCVLVARLNCDEAGYIYWDELPDYFDLPSWEELEVAKTVFDVSVYNHE